MKCPKCPSEIHAMTIEGVELDFCSGCKGMWFDKGEMAFMAEMKEDFPHLETLMATTKTKHVCPRCPTMLLEEVKFSSLHDLALDRCPKCHGVWLDKGELPKVESVASEIQSPQSSVLNACVQLKKQGYDVLGFRKP